jgi:4-aminobutyrate aminotransferase-like enzyme
MNTFATGRRGKMNNAFDPATADKLDPSTRALVARRQRALGPAYRLFYTRPVELVRGSGTRLYDRDGREYLDAYNNVVPVGHAHPAVVEAIATQASTLVTNTRYLHNAIVDYAEQLLASFGGRIGDNGHVMFTCTGSEANDLATRIAKHRTGKRGIIVTAEAYHGNSDLTASFSPSLGDHSPLGLWVRRVPAPDSYRMAPATLGHWWADRIAEQIADLERHGEGLAALIVDSLFSSDGIFAEPTDLLGPAANVVHRAGGLLIADEVQSGFARSGDRFWGYQRHGADPDIVTMGKPMGNGFPVAAAAMAHDVVNGFGRDTRYFNTFGGNTMAVAAAQATLDVIRGDDLLGNSGRVGAAIRLGIAELATRHEGIGDVRGAGLYTGVEIVSDRDARTPDGATAASIVNAMRDRGVLISATGAHGNTLKIRPPLVFSADDAAQLLETLEQALAAQKRHVEAS